MTKKHSSAGIIAARYLDQGLSLHAAVLRTLADHQRQGCRFAADGLSAERIIASVKAHLCEAIEAEEVACAERESAA